MAEYAFPIALVTVIVLISAWRAYANDNRFDAALLGVIAVVGVAAATTVWWL